MAKRKAAGADPTPPEHQPVAAERARLSFFDQGLGNFSAASQSEDVGEKLDEYADGLFNFLCDAKMDILNEFTELTEQLADQLLDLHNSIQSISTQLAELRAIAVSPRTISRPWPSVVGDEIAAPSDATKSKDWHLAESTTPPPDSKREHEPLRMPNGELVPDHML